jgi:ABC-type enterochelin transport system permease subunit
MFTSIGKMLIMLGMGMVVIGVVIILVGKVPFLGKLPGDIHIQKKDFGFYFPLGTCIVVSIVLSLLLSAIFIFLNLFKK